jgi:hypothetical protein
MDRCGLMSVSKCFTTLWPLCMYTAISVIPLAAAYPPVVSISTMAYMDIKNSFFTARSQDGKEASFEIEKD